MRWEVKKVGSFKTLDSDQGYRITRNSAAIQGGYTAWQPCKMQRKGFSLLATGFATNKDAREYCEAHFNETA